LSGGAGPSQGQVECLVEAECHALGIGPPELFLPDGGSCRVEAVAAVARFEWLPRFCMLVVGGGRAARADELAARLPRQAWQQLSARTGAKGRRYYDWAWITIAGASPGCRWLLIRRNRRTGELAFYCCYSPRPVPPWRYAVSPPLAAALGAELASDVAEMRAVLADRPGAPATIPSALFQADAIGADCLSLYGSRLTGLASMAGTDLANLTSHVGNGFGQAACDLLSPQLLNQWPGRSASHRRSPWWSSPRAAPASRSPAPD
jgi:hypothetical protein